MPPRDYNFRDEFPDMTIPDRTDTPAQPWQPMQPLGARASRSPWREGDRVLAPWEPDALYAGRVVEINGDQLLIQFDDGDAGWVMLSRVQALAVPVGHKVQSRKQMGMLFYPGEVAEMRGDQVRVRFADGQEEWTSVAALRIPCQPGPGATPTKMASNQAFLNNLREGFRVWAHWANGMLFAGTVTELRDQDIHVQFDDGDAGWVRRDQVMPLEFPIGLRVLGRWKMGPVVYPGTVTQVQGERIHIQYDDGDREWTKPAALSIMGQAAGPGARPTKTAFRAPVNLRWLIPVLIFGTLIFLRVGCR